MNVLILIALCLCSIKPGHITIVVENSECYRDEPSQTMDKLHIPLLCMKQMQSLYVNHFSAKADYVISMYSMLSGVTIIFMALLHQGVLSPVEWLLSHAKLYHK